eukprot:CAMPEP_0116577992 /NCGR_PEP_ID=MMETSP0397-20121206/21450_1 /TAXON_ID=216820 /ORGANISM="Cyclophora tenuis, Strain ECT3854" /LENGTH=109 /DNA_ID=CAMNT_0004107315 /DNA_START=195 /DNA_END=524 /DNA_ORIENTATION=-
MTTKTTSSTTIGNFTQQQPPPPQTPEKQQQQTICEHVPFHLALLQYNASLGIYIQPKFLNDGPYDNRMTTFGGVRKRWEPIYQQSFQNASLAHYYKTMNCTLHTWLLHS